MNRFRFMLGLLLCSALLCLSAAAQEIEHPEFLLYLNRTYDKVESHDAYYNTGFAIVKKGEKRLLGCFGKTQSGWQLVFENEKAVPDWNPTCHVYMDTEEVLFYTIIFPQSDTQQVQDYRLKDGQWVLESIVDFADAQYDTEKKYGIENHANFSGNEITLTKYLVDENDNILSTRVLRPLPLVISPERLYLHSIDNQKPLVSGTGYNQCDLAGQYPEEILKGLFDKLLSNAKDQKLTYVDGLDLQEGLLFIADDAAGTRSLYCGAYDQGWSFTQSTPLPPNTVFGYDCFITMVNFNNEYGPSIIRYDDGTWGINYIQSGTNFCQLFQNGVLEDGYYCPRPVIGQHPYNDITKIDWLNIPESPEKMLAQIDPAGFATPNNPDVNDRLHLRKEPNKDASSLGKYYNGTPLKVLQKKGEWTKVQIGYTEGWMMTKYLAFGGDMLKVKTNLLVKVAVNPVTPVHWFTKTGTRMEKLWYGEATRVTIVGVIEDEWYLVWDPLTNAFGKIRQSDLWDGNG